MRSKLFLCAEEIILNAYTNGISAMNIFENMDADRFPLVIQSLMWLNILERDPAEPNTKEFQLVVYINEVEIHRMTVNVNFNTGLLNKAVAIITNLSVPKPGLFRSVFRDGKEVLSTYEFQIGQMRLGN